MLQALAVGRAGPARSRASTCFPDRLDFLGRRPLRRHSLLASSTVVRPSSDSVVLSLLASSDPHAQSVMSPHLSTRSRGGHEPPRPSRRRTMQIILLTATCGPWTIPSRCAAPAARRCLRLVDRPGRTRPATRKESLAMKINTLSVRAFATTLMLGLAATAQSQSLDIELGFWKKTMKMEIDGRTVMDTTIDACLIADDLDLKKTAAKMAQSPSCKVMQQELSPKRLKVVCRARRCWPSRPRRSEGPESVVVTATMKPTGAARSRAPRDLELRESRLHQAVSPVNPASDALAPAPLVRPARRDSPRRDPLRIHALDDPATRARHRARIRNTAARGARAVARTPARSLAHPESLADRAGLQPFDVTIARLGIRDQRPHERTGRSRDLLNRTFERHCVRFRRRIETAQLPHELQRRIADLGVGRRRIEIEQRSDTSADGHSPQ